jgi:MOSC domain-containing protein YiiM
MSLSDLTAPRHLTTSELEAGLAAVRSAPQESGRLELIVRRPRTGGREVLDVGELDLALGLVGDRWSEGKPNRAPNPGTQVTLMSARAAGLFAVTRERWPLAGDQLYVDMDVSEENLPAGTQLAIGSAVVEISTLPHTGCKKFVERFGMDAMLFVNSEVGQALRLRGVNTKVVVPGSIRVGDLVRRRAV